MQILQLSKSKNTTLGRQLPSLSSSSPFPSLSFLPSLPFLLFPSLLPFLGERERGKRRRRREGRREREGKGKRRKEKGRRRKEKKKMKSLLKTYGKDALRNTFWSFCRFDDPDATMLRFLRARRFNVEKAINMLAAVLKFRLDVNIDHLIEKGDLGNMKEFKGLVENQVDGKVYVHGCDMLEQPICYVELRKHSIMGQPSDSMKKVSGRLSSALTTLPSESTFSSQSSSSRKWKHGAYSTPLHQSG